MKKEVCAAGIILCLIAGAVWNVYHLENLAGRMTEHIRAAETAEAEGRSLQAEQELRDLAGRGRVHPHLHPPCGDRLHLRRLL